MKLLEKLGPFDRKSGKLNVVIKSPKLPEQRNSFVSTNLKPTVLSKDCTRLPPNLKTKHRFSMILANRRRSLPALA